MFFSPWNTKANLLDNIKFIRQWNTYCALSEKTIELISTYMVEEAEKVWSQKMTKNECKHLFVMKKFDSATGYTRWEDLMMDENPE